MKGPGRGRHAGGKPPSPRLLPTVPLCPGGHTGLAQLLPSLSPARPPHPLRSWPWALHFSKAPSQSGLATCLLAPGVLLPTPFYLLCSTSWSCHCPQITDGTTEDTEIISDLSQHSQEPGTHFTLCPSCLRFFLQTASAQFLL